MATGNNNPNDAIGDVFKQAFLTAVKGEDFDADEAFVNLREGFVSAMLTAKKARDEVATDRLAALAEKLGFF